MARKVRWSALASSQFQNTLEFWMENNKSSTYSRKIFKETETALELLSRFPHIGRKANDSQIRRIVVQKLYAIYYSFDDKTVDIKVWRPLKMNSETNEFEI